MREKAGGKGSHFRDLRRLEKFEIIVEGNTAEWMSF